MHSKMNATQPNFEKPFKESNLNYETSSEKTGKDGLKGMSKVETSLI